MAIANTINAACLYLLLRVSDFSQNKLSKAQIIQLKLALGIIIRAISNTMSSLSNRVDVAANTKISSG